MNSKNYHPLVSVIILNWNKPQDTVSCIESVKNQAYKNLEIIVVDNGSVDNSLSILKKQRGILLIKNPRNRGFTGGHIDGLKFAKGKFILVLNNDAIIEKEYITNAVSVISKDDNIAVVGGRSYVWGGKKQNDKSVGQFYAFQTINQFSGEGIFAQTDVGYDHEVNWVSGSSMLLRKSAIDDVGYFYEPMFAYYEESDLFARLQTAGYTIVYSPSLRIHHKDGESSSSYFQFNQLFKNRFIFAIRNFDKKSILSFIKSYIHSGLRSLYHYLIKETNDNNSKIMNKAFSNAFIHSALSWPRWAFSRHNLIGRDSSGLSLNDKLKIEQTGISFICDLTKDVNQLTKLTDFINLTSYKHYNSEVVVVCNISDKKDILRIQKKSKLINTNLIIIFDTEQFNTNPLNIGWLSSSKEFVCFITTDLTPSIESINRASLALKSSKCFYCDTPSNNLALNNATNTIFYIPRSILSTYGGLDDKSLEKSLGNILYFASINNNINIKSNNLWFIKFAQHQNPIKDLRLKVDQILIDEKQNIKKQSPYSKLIERYYRLRQLNSLVTWLFINKITPRHKLARLKNLVIHSISLNKNKLAIELKHINNEVIRSTNNTYTNNNNTIRTKATKRLIKESWKQTPVFIISRDRVNDLKKIIKWLENIGMTNITIIDNDSLYPPLLDYYSDLNYQIIRTRRNVGHKVAWQEGIVKTLVPNDFYILSDPDVVPSNNCPSDVIEHLYRLHIKYGSYKKIGLGLKIDDLPNHYKLKDKVLEWEKQFWKNELEPNIFEAGVDTTFALYKPYTYHYFLHPSIRTGEPYTAMHMPWYIDSNKISEEETFYRLRANQDITSWNTNEILERYKKELSKQ